MTWFMVDDGFSDSAQVDDLSLAAVGLWVKAGSWVGHQRQRYGDEYDGLFSMQRVKALGGSPKLAQALVDAKLWEQRKTHYKVVESPTTCKFAGGKELSEARSKSGSAGGKATAAKRKAAKAKAKPQAKRQASATAKPQAKAEASAQASATANGQAKPLAKSKQTGKQTSSKGNPIPIPTTHTDTTPLHPPAENREPNAVTMADAEAGVLADPFTAAWNAYPRHAGSRKAAQDRWHQALDGAEGMRQATPEQLLAAVLRYAKSLEGDARYAPGMAKWLQTGQYTEWLPKQASRSYEWGGITRVWIREHITRHLPPGTFTESREQGFWAEIKTGRDPIETATEIIETINGRNPA
ncbi:MULTISPECIES: hypothetical protein [Bifidobacterium]|jgi:hypothetical protein|nr:hypothetical protein [Bifidobacterium tibiigranuli]MCI2186226.1 hypothetical protein [Bifidobacterium tibiigranuli]MCI2203947.1 hypothetical protein [Bifidobacterium tibiigranuli]